jgi:hypothetical protein
MKPDQIEWSRTPDCDVKGCEHKSDWSVKFKGEFSSWQICAKCLLETAQAMVMNMGV